MTSLSRPTLRETLRRAPVRRAPRFRPRSCTFQGYGAPTRVPTPLPSRRRPQECPCSRDESTGRGKHSSIVPEVEDDPGGEPARISEGLHSVPRHAGERVYLRRALAGLIALPPGKVASSRDAPSRVYGLRRALKARRVMSGVAARAVLWRRIRAGRRASSGLGLRLPAGFR